MLLNQNQIQEINDIINLQHILFIAVNIGPEMLSDFELQQLKDANLLFPAYFDSQQTPFDEMFRWGQLASSLKDKDAKKLNYQNFKDFLKKNKHIPFSQVERNALNLAKQQASLDVRGLGNRICKETHQLIINADNKLKSAYEKTISEKLVDNIKNRGSISELVSELGYKTSDWSRDFGRISDYVMTQAYEEGRAAHIKQQYGDDALVYKKVFETACKKCVQLYLTNGAGSEPRVFTITQLQNNGTNIGRKVDEWLPTVGPTHPHCRCMLMYVDSNYEWNPETQDFDKPKEFKRKVQRRSKVNIEIGDKRITV